MNKLGIIIADFTTQLAVVLAAGATSGYIQSAEDNDGVALPSGRYFFTLDGTSSQKEHISCDLVANSITNIMSVSRQGVETSGVNRLHRVGASVSITDFAHIAYMNDILRGIDSLDPNSPIGYSTPPAALTGNQLATVSYVLSVVTGGTVTFDLQVINGQVAGEALAPTQMVYFKESDQRWYLSDADLAATFDQVQMGICQSTAGTGGSIVVAISGPVGGFASLTPGAKYYLSNTSGAVSDTPGTTSVFIGWALTSATILFNPLWINMPTAAEKAALSALPSLTGMVLPYAGRTAPTGWLLANGSAVSRTAYAALFAVIAPSKTFTVTVASPAVFTSSSHGLVAGDQLHFTTTGALPIGILTGTTYYVLSTGLTANAFSVALSREGTVVNTSGIQSGVHTMYVSNFGMGDGSTTFNIPDMRSKAAVGLGQGTETLLFEPVAVNTGTETITVPDAEFPYQGMPVVLSTPGTLPGGLAPATTYYVIRASSTTIKLATTQANANIGTAINLTTQGTGVFTMTFTNSSRSIVGIAGGEETHGLSVSEMPNIAASSNNTAYGGGAGVAAVVNTSVGGDGRHNVMSPFVGLNYIVKT